MVKHPSCVGSSGFDPTALARDPEINTRVASLLQKDDFAGAIKAYFSLPAGDTYAYHAVSTVTLSQVQHVVSLGGVNGLHAWYDAAPSSPPSSSSPSPSPPPPSAQDIEAYISIFRPDTLTSSALKAFAANAKRNSTRAAVAAHLASRRYIHPACPALNIPKRKKGPAGGAALPPSNPSFDFWAWSCANLEWCGPSPASEARPQSHHLLPVLMHHFGCAVPSHEALEVLRLVAAGRAVADVGSGNGYWAFMLRQHGVAVRPVDSAQSAWRATWVGDTTVTDGAAWLARNGGGPDLVLLLVYPVVGGDGAFTRDLIAAYRGDTLAVVGTQNHNGYTSFRDLTLDEYMEREQPGWTRLVQIPLPSFAGKDEALFVYQRGERAAALAA